MPLETLVTANEMQPDKNVGWYTEKQQRKERCCNALKSALTRLSALNPEIKLPKKGNGSNSEVGRVRIKVGTNTVQLTVPFGDKGEFRTYIDLPIWNLNTLEMDTDAKLLLINSVVAAKY